MYDFRSAQPHYIAALEDLAEVLAPRENHLSHNGFITGFSIDSRTLKKGEVFVAIPGTRVDGHRFVDQALSNGAAACLVSSLEGIEQPANCLLVEDTVRALGYLAACHRRACQTKLIGLTGSVGKTTTKEILHTLLSVSFKTRKTQGNFNNTIGLPLELLKLEREDEWMVAEMGMSTPGEIRQLSQMAAPDIGLWLSVQAVHLVNFNHLEDIARAKAELLEGLEPGKTLVYNLDDPLVHEHCRNFPGRRVTYGFFHPEADIKARVEPFPTWKGTHFEIDIPEEPHCQLFLPLTGRFNVRNALAACTTALTAGLSGNELSYGLKMVEAREGRSFLHLLAENIQLVDDCYNANPYAVFHVLRCFAPLAPGHYRWLILGDMLELGAGEADIHWEMGKTIGGYGFDRVTLVGALSQHTRDGLLETKPPQCSLEHFDTVEHALAGMSFTAPPHARIWCKASRAIHLEQLVEQLKNQLSET